MAKKDKSKDVEIIIQYETKVDGKELKSLQEIFQKLFNSYISKVIQNIHKGR